MASGHGESPRRSANSMAGSQRRAATREPTDANPAISPINKHSPDTTYNQTRFARLAAERGAENGAEWQLLKLGALRTEGVHLGGQRQWHRRRSSKSTPLGPRGQPWASGSASGAVGTLGLRARWELGRWLDGVRGAARAQEREQQVLHRMHGDGHGARHLRGGKGLSGGAGNCEGVPGAVAVARGCEGMHTCVRGCTHV